MPILEAEPRRRGCRPRSSSGDTSSVLCDWGESSRPACRTFRSDGTRERLDYHKQATPPFASEAAGGRAHCRTRQDSDLRYLPCSHRRDAPGRFDVIACPSPVRLRERVRGHNRCVCADALTCAPKRIPPFPVYGHPSSYAVAWESCGPRENVWADRVGGLAESGLFFCRIRTRRNRQRSRIQYTISSVATP